MKRWICGLALAATALCFVACHRAGSTGGGTVEAAQPAVPHLNRAQPKLPTLKLWVGNQELDTEIARRNVEIYTGMMFRTNLAESAAMLFVFPGPDRRSFYMRNTQVPLTAAYIRPDGTIVELHDLRPFDERSVPSSSDQIQYVLEVAQGWFERHQITTGAVIRTAHGSFPEMDWRTLRARGRP